MQSHQEDIKRPDYFTDRTPRLRRQGVSFRVIAQWLGMSLGSVQKSFASGAEDESHDGEPDLLEMYRVVRELKNVAGAEGGARRGRRFSLSRA